MPKAKYLIFGGGMVAGYAAKELVDRGMKPGELMIVSSDTALPYERPPLSKGFLAGRDTKDGILINPESFYREHDIKVKMRCVAAGADAPKKALRLRSGEEIEFEKLIIATGARPRRLDAQGADLAGIYYLRSMDDSESIRAHAGSARRALVIGGGFIGMETASILAQKGVATTMLLREDRIWKRLFTPAMSRFFESYYQARGVEFLKETTVASFRGAGAVEAAKTQTGRSVECDMVIAGIGVTPVTEPLANSGIELNGGVVVNEYLETNQPDIYAAGDVASYQDPLDGKRRRVEHWDNAVSQGRHCARALLGQREPFVHVPYFFSDVFDLSYEFWGDTSGSDETVERGDLSGNSFSVWWLRQKQLVAAFTMNRPDDERDAAQRWIASKQRVSVSKLKGPGPVSDAAEDQRMA